MLWKVVLVKVNASLMMVSILTMTCSSVSYTSYANWDRDSDGKLDRYEFTTGYLQSKYFKKWTSEKKPMSYERLYQVTFNSLDTDHDEKLTKMEFDPKIGSFYKGNFQESFTRWDSDGNSILDKSEFFRSVCKTDLASHWDTSGDKRISTRELASGMFYIGDLDNNGRINSLEFNIWKINR